MSLCVPVYVEREGNKNVRLLALLDCADCVGAAAPFETFRLARNSGIATLSLSHLRSFPLSCETPAAVHEASNYGILLEIKDDVGILKPERTARECNVLQVFPR